MITGVPAPNVNPLVNAATSMPVVMVTVRAPVAALAAIVILTVAWAASVTVVELIVMPVPKFATVVPLTKLVNWPTTATLVIV